MRKKERQNEKVLTIHNHFASTGSLHGSQVRAPEPTATDIPQVNMSNPASVYCVQKGNKLEIHTAADGSQSGICVFPDGGTRDEWAYFQGACGPAAQESPTAMTVEATIAASGGYMPPGTLEELTDWWGFIKTA